MPSEKTEKSGKKIARRRSEGKERENSAFNKSATRFFYTQASTAIRGQGCSQRDSNILTFSRPTKKRSEKGACLLACVGVTAPFLLPSFLPFLLPFPWGRRDSADNEGREIGGNRVGGGGGGGGGGALTTNSRMKRRRDRQTHVPPPLIRRRSGGGFWLCVGNRIWRSDPLCGKSNFRPPHASGKKGTTATK